MNLPTSFKQQMQLLLGNETNAFEQALQAAPTLSVRINTHKYQNKFDENLAAVLWCNGGYYLPLRPVFTLDPLFHAGVYYVQEAASMYLEQVIKHILHEDNTTKVVLDLCAAPGGKSTHLTDLLPDGSLLVSNEIIRSRANILYENISKWGNPNCVVSNNDPHDFSKLNSFFDIILVDAPCSGEGMFRKDNKAIDEWSDANVKLCSERQRRILADIWGALKPNGYLIYSTCTYNLEENEKNVQWLMSEFGAVSIAVDYPQEWGISPAFVEGVHAARFMPHKTQSEGLFMALLQKKDNAKSANRSRNDKSTYQKLNKEFNRVSKWIKSSQNQTFIQKQSMVYALPSIYMYEIDLLNKHLKVLLAGIIIGEIKGTNIIPNAALALSQQIEKEEFATWDIDTDTALNYLRRNTIMPPIGMPKGYILLIHSGNPLGWIKNIGNRSNNLHPQEWRIRHL